MRLKNVENSNIIILQSTWLESDKNYVTSYFDWEKIVDKWMYLTDLKEIIE